MKMPPVRYAKTVKGLHVAYVVFGEGPVNLMLRPGSFATIEGLWEHPGHLRVWRWLSALAQIILFDPPGLGLSDPVPVERIGAVDDWIDAYLAVLDAVGLEKAVVNGEADGAISAITFAVQHPERTDRLVILNGFPRLRVAEDYPLGIPNSFLQLGREYAETHWGDGTFLGSTAPGLGSDPAFQEILARQERPAASPMVAQAMLRAMGDADIRELLPRVACPTLIIHTGDTPAFTAEHSRYLAEHIPGARLHERPPTGSFLATEPEPGSEWELFIAGASPDVVRERKLATVMFTDIASSTTRAVEQGDRRWLHQLGEVEAFVADAIQQRGGRVIKSTGDGHLATFERPSEAVGAAVAIASGVRQHGIEVRVGIHTGEIEIRADGDVGGLAVHIAARVSQEAGAGRVLVSRTVADLAAGSGFVFEDRGPHELKGVPVTWQLYEVAS